MKIYHTKTQEDYDALMIELEDEGYVWASGRKPTESKDWVDHKENTCVVIEKRMTRGYIGFLKPEYPNIPITKYKAKADEKMKFTKENVLKLTDGWIENKVKVISFQDLQNQIEELDETPEKAIVPKCIAEFYESKKHLILSEILKEFEINIEKEVADWYFSNTGRHDNTIANSQEIIAKMHLYGYTIEPEQLYYIPLPDLETSDGKQQVLSKRKNHARYFACCPSKKLKQRYTKEELEQVPEAYKPYATPVEEDGE